MQQKYIALVNCTIIFSLMHAGRQIMYPVVPLLVQEYGLSYLSAGILVSSYEIGYGSTLLAAGLLSERHRKTLFIGSAITMFAITIAATSSSETLDQLLMIRGMSGIAYGLYFASGVSLISSHFSPQERGRALGIHIAGYGFGKVYPPLLAALLIASLGWRPLFLLLGITAGIAAVIFWRTVKEPRSSESTTEKVTAELAHILTNHRLLRISLASGIAISCSAILTTSIPLYLVNHLHLERSIGAEVLLVYNSISIAGNFMLSSLSDRIGRRNVATVVFLTAATLLTLLPHMPYGPFLIITIAALGLIISSPFTILTTYVTELSGAKRRGAFLGLFNTITTLASAVALILAGVAADAFGISSIYLFLAAAALAGMLAVPKPQPYPEPRT